MMTRTQKISTLVFAISALFAGTTMTAQGDTLSRAQVKAELAEHIKNGYEIVNESGATLRDVFPHNYPQQNVSRLSAEQVQSELQEWVANGNVIVNESGATLRDVFPHNYPQPETQGLSREQVRAELKESIQAG